jgi:hypothetical protein
MPGTPASDDIAPQLRAIAMRRPRSWIAELDFVTTRMTVIADVAEIELVSAATLTTLLTTLRKSPRKRNFAPGDCRRARLPEAINRGLFRTSSALPGAQAADISEVFTENLAISASCVVEPDGIEPTTSSMPLKRSPN